MKTGPAKTIYVFLDRWGEAPALLAELENILPRNAKEAYETCPTLFDLRQGLRSELDSQE